VKNITLGYFELVQQRFLCDVTVNDFLNFLGRYVKLIIIPIIEVDDFRKIKRYKLDYIYISDLDFLLGRLLLREKLGWDIPFIFILYKIWPLTDQYALSIPLLRKSDIIITPSQYAKECFLRISDKFKVHVIPHFLDVNFIRNNISHNLKKDTKIITFMGRLLRRKGIGTLIECMPEIIAKVPNAHLNIIGPLGGMEIADHSKSSYVKKLEKRIKKLELTDRVHFKGMLSCLNKYKILSESNIFVNPTLALDEIFGIVTIEALACGVPVIATKWAANREIIRDGKNGFLVDGDYNETKNPHMDVKQLISLIVKVLKNEKLNLELKRNALRTSLNYDYHRVLPRFVNLLKKNVRIRVKNKWDSVKNRSVIDFRYLFNKEFFFFISLCYPFKKTYSSLYKEIFVRAPLESRYRHNRREINKHKIKSMEIAERIRQDFLNFIILKSNK
jgi:glycosyltransferase involved in cell wall biosynthesis